MLPSVSSKEGPATMVTLVTERLQQQRLTDSPCGTGSIAVCSAEKVSRHGSPSFQRIHGEPDSDGPCQSFPLRTEVLLKSAPLPITGSPAAGLSSGPADCVFAAGAATFPGLTSPLDLNGPCRTSPALPTKRHCHSSSETDRPTHCRSPWKPGSGSRVWTTVSRRPGSTSLPDAAACAPFSDVGQSRMPRPSSASSGFVDGSERSDRCSSSSSGDGPFRCFSVPQELLVEVALAPPRPRCHSQPSELQEHRNRLKRRYGDGCPLTRPALDFLKMTRTLKSSRSLCTLNCDDTGDPDADASPPAPGPELVTDAPVVSPVGHPSERQRLKCVGALSESDEDSSDSVSTDAAVFPLDCGDLDLEEIENN